MVALEVHFVSYTPRLISIYLIGLTGVRFVVVGKEVNDSLAIGKRDEEEGTRVMLGLADSRVEEGIFYCCMVYQMSLLSKSRVTHGCSLTLLKKRAFDTPERAYSV